jgi:PAS domain S-box-containing protein
MFVVVAITFGLYVYAENQVDRANELRHKSFLLADELRQSSDDLTRMVRTYVVTGDPIYKRHYQEILDIRDGKKPRPVGYSNIYWDLVLEDDRRPHPGGQAVPLLALMRKAGFTEAEFAKLAQAKANSDILTRPEFAAMALIESTAPATEANRLKATQMLNDASYHQAKYGIMLPISEFYRMMDQRTLEAVRAAESMAARLSAAVVAFGVLLVFTLWRAYRALYATLGCSAGELQGRITRLGGGDFSSAIPVPMGMENSVLGWLSETQIDLARIDAERKRAETAMREALIKAQRLATALDSVPSYIYIKNKQHQYVYANRAVLELFKCSAEELPGSDDTRFFPLEAVARLREVDNRVMERGETTREEIDVSLGSPDQRVYWEVKQPFYDESGEIWGLCGVSTDITERKRMEDSIKTLNENLENRVKEETAKNMAQERLLIQQSRLAAMGEMIGNIAHQWRQPINALALLLANIKDAYEYHELDKEYLDKEVGKGQQMIQKMSSTIDDFRNFFKPNKAKQSFRASDGVEEAIKLVNESFKNNNIEIARDKSTEFCVVSGYPNEFAQVVLNALSNAKDAIIEKKAHGKVHVRFEQGTDTVTISIRDNGGGIPEEILPKVFDPYFTTKEKGTGIGLYMSKMIMDHMDGGIAIRNVDGGTEVLLTLPTANPAL